MTSDFESVPLKEVPFDPASSGPSLKARAVALLSRREYSRFELSRKLAPHARSESELQEVLSALAGEGWQSDERYVQGMLHRKSARQGTALIVQSLRQQGVQADLIEEARDQLRQTELERARKVWEKRFSRQGGPTDRQSYARQARFLAARGFSTEVINRLLRQPDAEA